VDQPAAVAAAAAAAAGAAVEDADEINFKT
jgi:hypothetical protein